MSTDQSRPVPRASEVQGIDRDALIELLRDRFPWAHPEGRVIHDAADRILALQRPVEGVTLTREEAADLAVAASVAAERLTGDGWAPRLRALAARLESLA